MCGVRSSPLYKTQSDDLIITLLLIIYFYSLQQAISIGRQTHQLTHSIYQLKEETGTEVRIVEMAQRTHELPAGLQDENTSSDE